MSALVLGATGLCGSFFLKYSLAAPTLKHVYTLTRRPLDQKKSESEEEAEAEAKLTSIVNKESSEWKNVIERDIEGQIDYLFTALATTRAAAGGLDNQYKIDHDLNLELAKVAKAKGCKTLVVISSSGASVDSRLPYFRMKGEIERDLVALGFERTIILRPGALLGERRADSAKGFLNDFAVGFTGFFYRKPFLQRMAMYPVYGEEVSQVGVHLALGKDDDNKQKVRIVESKEILEIAASLKKN